MSFAIPLKHLLTKIWTFLPVSFPKLSNLLKQLLRLLTVKELDEGFIVNEVIKKFLKYWNPDTVLALEVNQNRYILEGGATDCVV